ncbi:hypothetical protein JCM8547_005651 [Rhodosporidiobolus lusitaniae]
MAEPRSVRMREFVRGGGDKLLADVTWRTALAAEMNRLNGERRSSHMLFRPEDVHRRLEVVRQKLMTDGTLQQGASIEDRRDALITALDPPAGEIVSSSEPPAFLHPPASASGPAGSTSLGPYATSRAIVSQLPPNVRGDLGQSSPYDQHRWVEHNQEWLRQKGYMSLGTARPLRHAVIYGEGRRRF